MKNTAHNLMEVKALVKEAYQSGNEMRHNLTKWFSHSGKYICQSIIRDTEFDLFVEDVEVLNGYRSVTVEV